MKNPVVELSSPNGTGIDVDAMLAIHRGPDGFIGFLRKNPETGVVENVGSVPASELKTWLPKLLPYILEDSYFTVNAPYRAAPYPSKVSGLPSVWRKESQMRYLNACYVDLDVGRLESENPEQRIAWSDALSAVLKRTDRGELIPPSMAARSGRGLYLFWLLRHRSIPDQPPFAFQGRELKIYRAVNQVLVESLKNLAADIQAVDAARVLRVPGSVHRSTRRQVIFLPLLDQNGKPFIYTLEEMADSLGIETLRGVHLPEGTERLLEPGAGRRTPPNRRGTSPKRRAGALALNAKRADDMLTVCDYFGGWVEGERWYKLILYARLIRQSGASSRDTLRAVSQMAKTCKPPYPSTPEDWSVADIVRQAIRTPLRFTNGKLLKWLRITPLIARELELKTILPEEVKAERRKSKSTKVSEIKRRREFIRAYLANHRTPTYRAMADILKVEGFNVEKDTVRRDYAAIKKANRGSK